MTVPKKPKPKSAVTEMEEALANRTAETESLEAQLAKARTQRDQHALELSHLDQVLTRRPALDSEPTRVAKVEKAIATARRVDEMERRVEERHGLLGKIAERLTRLDAFPKELHGRPLDEAIAESYAALRAQLAAERAERLRLEAELLKVQSRHDELQRALHISGGRS